jgi:hypothetical protein
VLFTQQLLLSLRSICCCSSYDVALKLNEKQMRVGLRSLVHMHKSYGERLGGSAVASVHKSSGERPSHCALGGL